MRIKETKDTIENFSIEVETPFLKKYSRIEKSHYENKIMWVGLKAD